MLGLFRMDVVVPPTRVEELKGILSERRSALAALREQKIQAQQAALAARERAAFIKRISSQKEWDKARVAFLANAARYNARTKGVTWTPVANAVPLSTAVDDTMAADATGVAIQNEIVAISAAELALENDIKALGDMLSKIWVNGGRRTRNHGRKISRKTKRKTQRRK